jgi:hypothetical protein
MTGRRAEPARHRDGGHPDVTISNAELVELLNSNNPEALLSRIVRDRKLLTENYVSPVSDRK